MRPRCRSSPPHPCGSWSRCSFPTSCGESWERTSGNEFAIIVAALALVILPQALSVAAGAMFEKADLLGIILSQGLASVASVMGLAMSVALYGMIIGTPKDAAAAFD